jgi:hypothetical protein
VPHQTPQLIRVQSRDISFCPGFPLTKVRPYYLRILFPFHHFYPPSSNLLHIPSSCLDPFHYRQQISISSFASESVLPMVNLSIVQVLSPLEAFLIPLHAIPSPKNAHPSSRHEACPIGDFSCQNELPINFPHIVATLPHPLRTESAHLSIPPFACPSIHQTAPSL